MNENFPAQPATNNIDNDVLAAAETSDVTTPELAPGMPETEPERRRLRGLIGVGLAAGSLFLGACGKNGVEHVDPKAQIVVTCDVSDITNLPQAQVSIDQSHYKRSITGDRTITEGDQVTQIDTIQAFDISCVERRPDGLVISQKIPTIDIGVPGNPFRDDLQFWQLGVDPEVDKEVTEKHKVSYVLTVEPDETAAEGFSVSTLHLFNPGFIHSPGSAEKKDHSISVDFTRLDHPDSVRITSVSVTDGPGYGQFGDVPMHNGNVQWQLLQQR